MGDAFDKLVDPCRWVGDLGSPIGIPEQQRIMLRNALIELHEEIHNQYDGALSGMEERVEGLGEGFTDHENDLLDARLSLDHRKQDIEALRNREQILRERVQALEEARHEHDDGDFDDYLVADIEARNRLKKLEAAAEHAIEWGSKQDGRLNKLEAAHEELSDQVDMHEGELAQLRDDHGAEPADDLVGKKAIFQSSVKHSQNGKVVEIEQARGNWCVVKPTNGKYNFGTFKDYLTIIDPATDPLEVGDEVTYCPTGDESAHYEVCGIHGGWIWCRHKGGDYQDFDLHEGFHTFQRIAVDLARRPPKGET